MIITKEQLKQLNSTGKCEIIEKKSYGPFGEEVFYKNLEVEE